MPARRQQQHRERIHSTHGTSTILPHLTTPDQTTAASRQRVEITAPSASCAPSILLRCEHGHEARALKACDTERSSAPPPLGRSTTKPALRQLLIVGTAEELVQKRRPEGGGEPRWRSWVKRRAALPRETPAKDNQQERHAARRKGCGR
jgi:hypothetical protein